MHWNLARFYIRLLMTAGRDLKPSVLWNLGRSMALVPVHRRFGPDRLPFGPVRVYLTVTRACNRRCDFCSYRDELQSPSDSEAVMDLEVFTRLLGTQRVREALALHIYGGEPLLHDDLPRMIGMARGRGHLVTVNTNGLLLAEKVSEWNNGHPHLLSISYDESIEDQLAAGLAAVPPDVVVKLSLVGSRKRLDQIPAFFEFAHRNQVPFLEIANLQRSPDPDDEPLAREDERFLALKSSCEAEYGDSHVIFWPPLVDLETRSGRPDCEMVWTTLFLDVDGGVSPCCTLPLSSYQGTILEGEDPWNGARLCSARRDLRSDQPPSWCSSCCYLHYNELP